MRSILKLFLFWLILLFTPLLKGWSQPVDRLLINELMINPNNGASLPPFEYIELYNNGSTAIDLGNITLHINTNQISLPTHHLAPRQYVILCSPESVNEFARFGNAIGLSRGYALSNTGATVKLTTNDEILDEVSYRDSWYNSSSKRNGGWSLERISPEWKCNINLNWSATLSLSGGTPGRSNTVWNKDFAPTLQIQHYHIQQNKVEIRFQIDAALLDIASLNSFSLDEGIGEATDVHVSNGSIILTFAKVVDPQKLYTLQFNGLKLCNLAIASFESKLFDQKEIQRGDIVINEILFNPREGGVDFVEIYNNTDYSINLQNFKLGNRTITSDFYLLESHQHLAITTHPDVLVQHYPQSHRQNILQTAALPPYVNQQGIVTLYSDRDILIDSVYYNSNMHSWHLVQPKGVSLERLTPQKPLFHSASTLVGGATPGYQNSTDDLGLQQNNIHLTSKTVSPNGDGYEDELEINYELMQPNYIIAVEIYNEKGQLMRKLAHQNLAGTHGTLTWDGRNENGQPCVKGHYICYTRIFNHNGKTEQFKQPFVLIYSLTRH